LLIFLPSARRGWSWRSVVVAIPYAATFTLYTLANKYTTAANAIFLQDTAPFYILILGPLLLGERTRLRDLSFMAALLIGLGLIFASTREATLYASDPRLGDSLAVVSGLTWALTLLGLRWIAVRAENHDDEPAAAVVAGCLVASLFAALFAFPGENGNVGNWLIVAYLGVVQIALAYVFITAGIRHVRALEVSLLLLVEPVLSPVWVWLLLAESPAALAVLGGAIVIGATAVHAVRSGGQATAPLESS
ncbi:MAG: DMT family transporter, partial [Gammaproteobacteria bacterium]